MHEHDDDARVTPPRDDADEARKEHGRQLAMDGILQSACRGMAAAEGGGAPGTVPLGPQPNRARTALWGAACVAASILGVWGVLWFAGAIRSTDGGGEASAIAQGEGAQGEGAQGEQREGDQPTKPGSAPRSTSTQDKKKSRPGEKKADTPSKPQKKPSAESAAKKKDAAKSRLQKVAGQVGIVPPKKVPIGDGPSGTKKADLARRDIPEPGKDGKIVIPEDADPADIKALRSAQAMLEAEKNLTALLASGQLQGASRFLSFDEIAAWSYQDGLKGIPDKVKRLEGTEVLMIGFMLPIDKVENMQEFLLVQSLWSCCYGTPPDINGTVRVVMQGDKRSDYVYEPIKLFGKFRISETTEDGFCVDIYQLETSKVEVIK